MNQQYKKVEKQNKTSNVLKLAKATMPLLGNVAPNFTANLFFKLFTTPKKIPLKPPHLEILNRSNSFSYTINDVWGIEESIKIVGYSWNRSGSKKILLVHGWNGKASDYYKLIPELIDNDFQIDAIDCKAHGDSEGKRSSMLDFIYSLNGYFDNFGVPDIIIGHSLGATASIFSAIDKNLYIDKIVLLANPIIMKNAFFAGFDQINLPQKSQKLVFESAEKLLGKKIDDFDLTKVELNNFHDILEIYVDHDEEISNEDTMKLLQTHPEIHSIKINNCGHNYIHRNSKAIQNILQFIKK